MLVIERLFCFSHTDIVLTLTRQISAPIPHLESINPVDDLISVDLIRAVERQLEKAKLRFSSSLTTTPTGESWTLSYMELHDCHLTSNRDVALPGLMKLQ